MRWYRINAIVARHRYLFPRSFDRITDTLFWPVLDVVMWGLTSQWLTKSSGVGDDMMLSILTALVFWRIVWQANYEVGMNLLEECWNRNLTNVFSSPLTKWEWVVGNLLVGMVKLVIMLCVTVLSIWVFYSINIFAIGWFWILYCICATVGGWSLGFMASGMILYFGTRAQALAWTLAFLFAPICAVYFPLEMLPSWMRPISLAIPMTHIFESMRSQIMRGEDPSIHLAFSLAMSLVYLAIALWFFNYIFEHTRQRGFDHLE